MRPEGDVGLRSPNGTVAEEQNLVALSDGGLYAVYRTVEGHPCHAYSRDGGRTWSGPEYASYTPGGRLIKHPRACCKIWKCLNGKYLMWFHNHGGKSFEGRNPVWVLGGVERDGYMHWSQPEILLYDPKADNRISYPDLIEQDGRYWITETQKTIARVHEVDASLLEGLWNQGQARGPAPAGPAGEGMTIEAAFTTDRLGLSGVLADARKEGQGAVLELTAAGTARLTITAQGHEPFSWESDQGLLTPGRRHQVAVIADEASRIVMFVVDGQLCDGGTQRPNGWTRLPEGMSVPLPVDQAEAGSAKGLSVERARLFKRPLRVSEVAGAIAN